MALICQPTEKFAKVKFHTNKAKSGFLQKKKH